MLMMLLPLQGAVAGVVTPVLPRAVVAATATTTARST
jgi:hypothetical protein